MADPREPQPGELQYKEWLKITAAALDIAPNSLAMRMARGKYPKPEMRVVNPRLIYVKVNNHVAT